MASSEASWGRPRASAAVTVTAAEAGAAAGAAVCVGIPKAAAGDVGEDLRGQEIGQAEEARGTGEHGTFARGDRAVGAGHAGEELEGDDAELKVGAGGGEGARGQVELLGRILAFGEDASGEAAFVRGEIELAEDGLDARDFAFGDAAVGLGDLGEQGHEQAQVTAAIVGIGIGAGGVVAVGRRLLARGVPEERQNQMVPGQGEQPGEKEKLEDAAHVSPPAQPVSAG